MPLDCVVSGEILNANNELAEGIKVYCKTLIGPDLITDAEQKEVAESDEDGLVSFVLPQGSTAYLSGHFHVNGISFRSNDGIALSIPAASTVDLIDLVAAATFPTQGAVVQDDGVALATLIGTLNAGTGISAEQTAAGVARFHNTLLTATQAAHAFLGGPVSGAAAIPTFRIPVAADISDFAAAVGALAGSSAWGGITGTLSNQTDLQALFTAIGPRNAANGYAGLSAGGLLTESQIPSSIARDSEVTALTDALTAAVALKADLASPALTGTPTAPTAAAATNTTQIATTAFVRTEVASLVNAAPTTLDQLNELAAALGDDPNFAATMATALGLKANTSSLAAVALSGSASDLSAGILATARGGFGADMSAAAGVSLWAAGVPTLTGTSGTGNFARVTSPTFVTPVLGVASATSLALSNGSVGAPALRGSDADSGFYFDSNGFPAFAINGAAVLSSDGSGNYSFASSIITTSGSIVGRSSRVAFEGNSSLSLASVTPIAFANSTSYFDTKDLSLSRISAGLAGIGTGAAGSFAGSLKLTDLYTNNAAFLIRTNTSLTAGATANAPTLTTGPVTGEPTKWISIDDNGVTRRIPTWN